LRRSWTVGPRVPVLPAHLRCARIPILAMADAVHASTDSTASRARSLSAVRHGRSLGAPSSSSDPSANEAGRAPKSRKTGEKKKRKHVDPFRQDAARVEAPSANTHAKDCAQPHAAGRARVAPAAPSGASKRPKLLSAEAPDTVDEASVLRDAAQASSAAAPAAATQPPIPTHAATRAAPSPDQARDAAVDSETAAAGAPDPKASTRPILSPAAAGGGAAASGATAEAAAVTQVERGDLCAATVTEALPVMKVQFPDFTIVEMKTALTAAWQPHLSVPRYALAILSSCLTLLLVFPAVMD
jgi:hypothetical protein